MSIMKVDALHTPTVPSSRRHLAFRGNIDELHEYYEHIAVWGIDTIERVSWRQGESCDFMLLTLHIVGGAPESIVQMFIDEKKLWDSIRLRSIREGQSCN
ncbi:MAG TPA: hypothetical protein VKP88_02325 [Candidatus Paceibacterota bacterium]|nr:hypothetical protein [Candidatus Paceibacterota bacterium]